MKTPNDISSRDISSSGLRLLIRLSGLKQVSIAARFNISKNYLSMILSDDRKGNKMRLKIYKFLTEHNFLIKKIAA